MSESEDKYLNRLRGLKVGDWIAFDACGHPMHSRELIVAQVYEFRDTEIVVVEGPDGRSFHEREWRLDPYKDNVGLGVSIERLERPPIPFAPPVKAGVVIIIEDADGKILLGKRKGNHEPGTWGLVGGRMELQEAPEDTAKREMWEEAGVLPTESFQVFAPCPYTNTYFPKTGQHYITLFFYMKIAESNFEITVREPDKCEEWRWFHPNALPSPLFLPLEQNIDKLQPFTMKSRP